MKVDVMPRAALALGLALFLGAHASPGSTKDAAPYAFTSCYIDSDSDGLNDCYETNTHVYVSVVNTGTDPANPDTDGDGLSDGDEVNGTAGGLNLPLFGVNPLHKDILLEYDWLADSHECAPPQPHSHKPPAGMLPILRDMFAAAPVANPDGTTGIHLFQDLAGAPTGGQFLLTESNLVPDDDGNIIGGPNGDEFMDMELHNFPANRQGYFHYVIFAHYQTGHELSSGIASLPGHRIIISIGCLSNDPTSTAYTMAHELGHNLGLYHGGFEECNKKPNYNSVMNYAVQWSGSVDCTLRSRGYPDYSHGWRRDIDENAVNEPAGVCNAIESPVAVPVDFNHNHTIEPAPYARDLNPNQGCSSALTVLKDFDDWKHVDLSAVNLPYGTPSSEPCPGPSSL